MCGVVGCWFEWAKIEWWVNGNDEWMEWGTMGHEGPSDYRETSRWENECYIIFTQNILWPIFDFANIKESNLYFSSLMMNAEFIFLHSFSWQSSLLQKQIAFLSALSSADFMDSDDAGLAHISALNAKMEIFPSTGITPSTHMSQLAVRKPCLSQAYTKMSQDDISLFCLVISLTFSFT